MTRALDPLPPVLLLPPQEIIIALMMSSVAIAAKRKIVLRFFCVNKMPNAKADAHQRPRVL